MTLPNLLIIGAAKSGTTSLYEYLKQHPEIFMCTPKEPHFLILNQIGVKRIPIGVSSFSEYVELFSEGRDKKYRGEASVMYLSFPEILIKNIRKYLSDDVKIIIMLRNPVDRAYAGYQHVKRYNMKEDLSFEKALELEQIRYDSEEDMTPASRYRQLGLYYNQVKKIKEEFSNVHVIIYDDYVKDVNVTLKEVLHFLGLEHIDFDTSKRHMIGGWQWKNEKMKRLLTGSNQIKRLVKSILSKRFRAWIRKLLIGLSVREVDPMKKETRDMLIKCYKEDVQKLSNLLQKNLNHWTK